MTVHKSQLIKDNQKYFIDGCNRAYKKIKPIIKSEDTTRAYGVYNLFAVTSGDQMFYKLYQELKDIIRNYHGKNEPLWMQAWLNYHAPQQLLDWHDHWWLIHGYVSIDPKDTTTIFEDGSKIKNKVGNIYIGPCKRTHKVTIDKNFSGHRITIGFDVIDQYNYKNNDKISFIPI